MAVPPYRSGAAGFRPGWGVPAALRGGGSGVILRQFPSGDWVVAAGDFAVLYGLRGGAVCSGFSFPGKFVPGSMLVDELAGAARSVPALSAFSSLSWPVLFSPVAAGCWRCLRRRSGRFGPLSLYPFSSPFSSPAGASRNFVLAALRSASRCSGSIPVTTVWASSRTSAYMARYISSDGDVSNHDLCDLPDDLPDRGMYLVFPASGR